MNIESSKLIKFAKVAHKQAKKVISEYSSKYSRKDYTQQQLLALLCVKEKTKQKWEEFEDLIFNMPLLRQAIGLDKTPHFTTLNKFFLRLQKKILIILITLTAGRSSGLLSIDGTCVDRRHTSKHYVKRCKLTLNPMKLTPLIDTKEQKIHGLHCTTTRKHDTQILLPLLKKTRQKIKQICGDKGYDDKKIRNYLRKQGIRPLIPYREFKKKHKYWNSLMNKKDYNQRSKSETVNSSIKRKYRDYLSSHNWWNQHKEAALLCVVYNVDRDVKKLLGFIGGFLKSRLLILFVQSHCRQNA